MRLTTKNFFDHLIFCPLNADTKSEKALAVVASVALLIFGGLVHLVCGIRHCFTPRPPGSENEQEIRISITSNRVLNTSPNNKINQGSILTPSEHQQNMYHTNTKEQDKITTKNLDASSKVREEVDLSQDSESTITPSKKNSEDINRTIAQNQLRINENENAEETMDISEILENLSHLQKVPDETIKQACKVIERNIGLKRWMYFNANHLSAEWSSVSTSTRTTTRWTCVVSDTRLIPKKQTCENLTQQQMECLRNSGWDTEPKIVTEPIKNDSNNGGTSLDEYIFEQTLVGRETVNEQE